MKVENGQTFSIFSSSDTSWSERSKYLTYDYISTIIGLMTIIIVLMIIILRKVYENYSSMIMLIAILLMAVDSVIMAAF